MDLGRAGRIEIALELLSTHVAAFFTKQSLVAKTNAPTKLNGILGPCGDSNVGGGGNLL